MVDPEGRDATVWRPGRELYVLGEQDKITGESVLPGFRCRVADFLRMPGEEQVTGMPENEGVRTLANGKPKVHKITPSELPPADFFDPVIEAYKKEVDRTLLQENLRLTPEERSRKFARNMRMVYALRRSRRDLGDKPSESA